MTEIEMDLLIAQQRDNIETLQARVEEMRRYIVEHTRINGLARTIEDATKNLSVAIVQADYHLALVELEKAVRASAGSGLNGKAFAPELERLDRARSTPA